MVEDSARLAVSAKRTASGERTGSVPGRERSKGERFVFGAEELVVGELVKSFVAVCSWACTSRPIRGRRRRGAGGVAEER